jgi:hypothetical protein
MIKTQLTLYLKNRPGELARATRALTAAGTSIEGISVAGTTDIGLVQIIVSNAAVARQALKEVGIPVTEQKVAVLTVANMSGGLSKLARSLASKKININYLYATACSSKSGTECSVVISTDDLRALERFLKGEAARRDAS